MNFGGKFDAKLHVDGSGAHPDAHRHVDSFSASTHAPSGAITVPDADLLFHGDFTRSGVDLILSRDDRELVVQDYFKGEKRAALASPDGAHLTGDIINALTGHVQYAQAAGSAGAGKAIGHVTKLTGTATAIRNGVSIILNQGDNVEKGDVVQSGSGSTLGITFIDGTVFGLSSNARMVLNEMVYDPNGSSNSSLISLVAGTISFVAGQTAKHGDMKIDTPVATMGIRGTAVLVEIDFDTPGQNGAPEAKFQVLQEPDGTTGSYILFDKNTLAPIAIVDKAGQRVDISDNVVSFHDSSFTPELQKLITDVFTLKFSVTTPQSFTHFTDTLIPQQTWLPVQFANNGPTPVVHLVIPPIIAISAPSFTPALSTIPHINQAPLVATTDNSLTERAGVTGSTAADITSGTISFADINIGDRPTASATISSFSYQNAQHQTIGASPQELLDIHTLEAIPLQVVQASGNSFFGSATWTLNVPDYELDFLGAGDTLTLTYQANVDSNYSGGNLTGVADFTVTLTGTNDAPVITSKAEKVAFLNVGTTTPGPNLPPTPTGPTTNKLAFDDPDLTDTHTVSTDLTAATLSGTGISTLDMHALEAKFPRPMGVFESALSAAVTTDSTGTGAGTITWTLADISSYYADIVPAGETLTLTYTVTVMDSQGATSSQNVIVTITGSEPAAVVWVETTATAATDPAPGDWNGANNWETGTVPIATDAVNIITDQLQGQTPFYPVTVKAGATAFAYSVTMNDFADLASAPGATAPELDVGTATLPNGVTTNGSLTIGTEISLNADSILKVFGTLSVGTIAEILGNSVLQNSGTITLGEGGQFGGSSSITNSGTIEVVSDELDVQVNIANSSGKLKIDNGATLKLSSPTAASTTITSGNLILGSGSTFDVESSGGATLDGVIVTGTDASTGPTVAASLIKVGASGPSTLKLDDGTSITNGTLAIGSGSTLDIEKGVTGPGATLDGVTVIGNDPTSTIDVGTTASGAAVALLDDGTSIKSATLNIAAGSTLDIEKGATGPGATLDGVTVIGNGTTSTIDVGTTASGAAVALLDDGTSIKNVTLNIAAGSTLDIEKGATGPGATLDGVTVVGNGTTSTIDVGTTASGATVALLDDGTSIKNVTLNIAAGSTLDIEKGATGPGATLDGVAVIGNGTTSTIDVGTTASGAAVALLDDGTSIKNATLNIAAGSTLDIEKGATGPGATLDGVAVVGNGATSTVDVGTTASGAAVALLDDGTSIKNVTLNIAAGSTLDIEKGATGPGATLDGVTVVGNGTTSTIDVGTTASGATVALLDDGTSIKNATLNIAAGSTLDIEKGATGPGATLDGVTVIGNGTTSMIDVGTTASATTVALLDDGTSIKNVTLNIAAGSTLDIEKGVTGPGATLDGVTVVGNGTTSMIDVGTTASGAAVALLDDGTSIKNVSLNIAAGSTLDIEKGATGPGATLDGVAVIGNGTTSTIDVGTTASGATVALLDDGTSIKNATLNIAAGSTLDIEKGATGPGATLDGVTVVGNGATSTIDVGTTASGATLTLDGGTSVTNGKLVFGDSSEKAFISIGGATLDDVTVSGGGETDVGSAAATGVILTLDGGTSITNGKLVFADSSDKAFIGTGGATLDDVTVSGGGETDVGSAAATGVTLTLDGGTSITNGKLVFGDSSEKAFISTGGATLDDVTVSGGGEIDVGSAAATGVTLTLDGGTSITGGKLVFADSSDKAFIGTGGATLDDVTVSGGETDVGSAAATGVTLTLDGGTSITNGKLVFGDSSEKAFISTGGATLDDVTVSGGGETDVGSAAATGVTLTLDGGTSITNGKLVFADSSDKAFIGTGGATLDDVTVTTVSGGGEIDVGSAAATGVTLTLDGGTSITGGKLVFADSSDKAFIGTGGATLDDVTVTTVSGGGETDVGSATATGVTLTLDGGTSITNGKLVFADSSDKAFIGAGGATLDDVTVSGGGEIDVGSAAATGVTLTLDGGTSITGGKLVFADSSDKAFIGTGGATLDDVTVSGGETDVGSAAATGVTLTLDGATLMTGGKLVFADSSDKAFIGTGGATLDDVTVSGGGETDVGSAAVTGVMLTLDGGTSITNGKLVFADSSDKAFVGTGGATLDDLTVSGGGETDVGSAAATGVTLTLDGGTSITNGKLVFADSSDKVFVGTGGATLDDVTVSSGGETDVGSATATGVTLTLDGGTSITNGKLVFADSSDKVFIGTGGATLDDVAVSGGGETDVGSTAATGVTLTLDGGTSITGGKLVFADSSDKVFVGTGGATLDDVTVSGGGETDVGSAAVTGVMLTLDGGTSITNGKLVFADSSDKAFIGTGGATLDDVSVSGGGEVDVGSAAVTGVVLTLNGTTINSGTVINYGTIDSTGGGVIDNADITNNGTIESTVGIMTIDPVVQPTYTLINSDMLEANGGELDITGEQVTNSGTLQAIGGGILKLTGMTVTNTGSGSVTVGAGSILDLVGAGTSANIDGGTIGNAGTIDNVSGSNTVSAAITNTGAGTVTIASGSTLTLAGVGITGGSVTDNGTLGITGASTLAGVTFESTAGGTDTIVNTGTLTLGSGGLTLGGSTAFKLALDGTGTLALNGNTIEATTPGMTLENDGNTISGAGQIGTTSNSDLTLDNASGLIEALGGTLKIETGNPVTNGGTLEANGATLLVTTKIFNSSLIEATGGGTLDLKGGGAGEIIWTGINPVAGSNGIALASSADTLLVDSATGQLQLTGNTAGGAVSLGGGTIKGNGTTAEILDNFNNTISGDGHIGLGNDQLTLHNDAAGIIDANVSGQMITIDTVATVNAGLIEATLGGEINFTGGEITNSNALTASDGSKLAFSNETVVNTGTINLDGSTTASQIIVHGTLTLESTTGTSTATGSGQIILTGDSQNAILSDLSGAATLVNVDNTISGSGSIGDADLTVQNDQYGVINATGTLALNAVNTINVGLLEATGTGTLQIEGTVGNSGLIEANGGTVYVASAASITGTSSVTITAGGTAEFAGSSTQPLDLNAAFSGAGTLVLDNSQHYGGTITGFGANDTIDLTDLTYSTTETDVWNSASDTLTITGGTVLHFGSGYNQNSFALTSDASGHTEVVSSPASASLSALDSVGNAVEGHQVAASLTDANATGLITYTWLENGQIVQNGSNPSFTPGVADLSKPLDVVIGFTDSGHAEQITAVAGTVAAPPAVSASSSAASTDENMPLTLNMLNVTFTDAGTDTIHVTLDVNDGTLALASSTPGVTETGTGAMGSPLILSGTLDAIDAALGSAPGSGIVYTPTTGYVGSDTLSVTASDGVFNSNTATVNLSVLGPVANNVAITNAGAPTSGGWVYDPENGHYYKYVGTETDWNTAMSAAAADNGAYLANITSGAENVFVSGLLPNGATAWTGGQSTQDTGTPTANAATFSWLNGPEAGAPFTYASWNNDNLPPGGGEPSGFPVPDGNIEALQVGSNGEWNDVPTSWSDAGYVEEYGGLTNQVAFTENTSTDIATSVLLGHDTDTDGGTPGVTAVGAAAHGTVTLSGDVISYDPDLDYSGADSFTYTISDGTYSSTATVTFDVAAVPTLVWNTSSGDWTTSTADWSTGLIPVAADDVTINAASATPYTVTIANAETASAQMLTLDSAAATLVDAGTLTLTGGLAVEAGAFEMQDGTLQAQSITVAAGAIFEGYGIVASPIAVTGTVEASGGTLEFANYVTGSGTFEIAAGATLEFDGPVSTGTTVAFEASTGTLILAQSTSFQGEVSGISSSRDVLDLGQLLSNGNVTATQAGDIFEISHSYDSVHGTTLLTVTDETQHVSTFVNLVGDYANTSWSASSDGHGGVDVTETPPAPPTIIAPQSGTTASNFVTMDYPGADQASGTGTFAYGINNSGAIVGGYTIDSQHTSGFEYDGGYSAIGVAGSQDNNADGINNLGEIAGFNSPVRSTPRYGFTDDGGSYTQINLPGDGSTTANGINDSGVVVGAIYLHGTPIYSGYIDNAGTITYLDASGTGSFSDYTDAEAINNAGQVVGVFTSTYGSNNQGFLYQNGTYTTINDPNGVGDTQAYGINNSGEIVGEYTDGAGKSHGFIDVNGVFTTVDDPLGTNTAITGINDAGQIVGYYEDSSGVYHGFAASLNGVSTQEDKALLLTTLSVSDAAAGTNPIEVTLDAAHGALTVADTMNLTVNGQGTDALTLTGTQAAIDAALASGLTYTPTLNSHFVDVLTVTANDLGHNGTGAALSTTQDVGIVITPADSIAVGATYVVSGASADTIAFAGSTGTLDLAQPSTFSGTILNFTGTAANLASSDAIDLVGFDATDTTVTSAVYNNSTGTTAVTVTDSSGDGLSAVLNFSGNDPLSMFKIGSSGDGAYVFDPPAAPATSTSTITASAANQILTGTAASDTFAFNFANVGHATVTDFHPATDTLQFSDHLFANLQAVLNATHDDGHGNTVIALDAHDTITLHGILKAQLNASDFHFV